MNQPLAVLASPDPSLTQAQSRHTQSEFVTFLAHVFTSSNPNGKSKPGSRHGNIAVAGIRLPLPTAKGKLPVPISSNLSQVDKRGWRLLRAPHWESLVDLLFLQLPEAVTRTYLKTSKLPEEDADGRELDEAEEVDRVVLPTNQ